MRQLIKLLIASFLATAVGSVHGADETRTIIIHAGTLLATPDEAPAQQQSIVISDGKVLEIRDGFIGADDIDTADSEGRRYLFAGIAGKNNRIGRNKGSDPLISGNYGPILCRTSLQPALSDSEFHILNTS